MNINEIVQYQLNAAIAGLTRARDRIAGMKPDDTHEIGRQIESAAFYLEDIQYNWHSWCAAMLLSRTLTTPDRETS